jgi:hypothetical protein
VGGDHAEDSCVMHVVEDGLLFLGDALAQRLHAPVEHLTIDGMRGVLDLVEAYGADVAIRGHWPGELMDGAAHRADLAQLRSVAERVERLGDGARATAEDEDDLELIGFFLAGR